MLNPLQEKKMELYRVIVKMEQDGGADSIQVLFTTERFLANKISLFFLIPILAFTGTC